MANVGYARVSTLDQDLSLQLDALAAAGCSKVFEDHASGARADREGLQAALDYVRDGEVLVVWKLDRLGRSLPHLIDTVLDSIDVTTPAGLRDRALIALMVYSFARIGAALGMKVEDVFIQNRRLWVRLREKGGKAHAIPCHHSLEAYLGEYLERTGIGEDGKGPLFRTIGRGTSRLTRTPLPQANAYAMIQRRRAAARIETKVGNHSFRATGITAYLKNGGTLEKAAAMANHASTRTTQLYDRRPDEVALDEVERIRI